MAANYKWTEEELKELKLVSEDFTLDELAKRFNKSKFAVEHKVYRSKLKYKRDTHIKWDVHEINRLRLLAKDHHIDEIVPLFEGKSKSTILRKLKELNYDYVHHNMQMNEEQKQFIRDNYNTLSQPEIGLKIGVSVTTVRNFMKSEGLKKDIIKWTEEKIDELRELAKCNSIDVLANHFNTTEASIKSVAFKNNIKITTRRFIWNDELIDKIIQYSNEGKDLFEIAVLLDIQPETLKHKYKELNIKHNRSNIPWTKDEINTLITTYNDNKDDYQETKYKFLCLLESKLPNKDIYSISSKLSCMKLSIPGTIIPLTDEQKEEIKNNTKFDSVADLMHEYKCTYYQIKNLIKDAKVHKNRSWTEEENEQLKILSSVYNPIMLAKMMNRGIYTIMQQQKKLKIVSSRNSHWNKDDDEKLKSMWGNSSIETICNELGRSENAIHTRRRELGLNRFRDCMDDSLTLLEIAYMFGVSVPTIQTTWIYFGLEVRIIELSIAKSMMLVEVNKLFDFLYNNKDIFDASKIPAECLDDMPQWIKEKYQEDTNNPFNISANVQLKKNKASL